MDPLVLLMGGGAAAYLLLAKKEEAEAPVHAPEVAPVQAPAVAAAHIADQVEREVDAVVEQEEVSSPQLSSNVLNIVKRVQERIAAEGTPAPVDIDAPDSGQEDSTTIPDKDQCTNRDPNSGACLTSLLYPSGEAAWRQMGMPDPVPPPGSPGYAEADAAGAEICPKWATICHDTNEVPEGWRKEDWIPNSPTHGGAKIFRDGEWPGWAGHPICMCNKGSSD